MNQLMEICIIAYMLGIFPLLLGSGLVLDKKKNICKAYLYGFVLQICAFMCLCTVAMHMGMDLFALTKACKILTLIATLIMALILIAKFCGAFGIKTSYKALPQWLHDTVSEYRPYLLELVIWFAVVVSFVFFMKDASKGGEVKRVLEAYYSTKLSSSASAYELYYAMLSVFSGMHPTVLVKWIMPFVISFCSFIACHQVAKSLSLEKKETRLVLYVAIWCCAFYADYYLLFVCLPLMLALGIENMHRKNGRLSLLTAIAMLSIVLAFPGSIMTRYVNVLPFVVLALALVVILVMACVSVAKYSENRGRKVDLLDTRSVEKHSSEKYLVRYSSLLLYFLLAISLCIKVYTIVTSGIAVPDNRYKVDADVMQVRMAVEPFSEVKLLAPIEVMDQITDIDQKVSILFDTQLLADKDISSFGIIGAWRTENINASLPGNIDDVELDLHRADYGDMKLLQHGLRFQCNVIAAYAGADRVAQDALYQEYDYQFLAECGKYVVYQYVEGLGEYEITQYASQSGNQSMIYTISDWEGHLVIVDGGWRVDAEQLYEVIAAHGGHVDAWILTHPHPDHIGAFNEIIENKPVTIDQIYAAPIDYEDYKEKANWWDGFEEYEKFLSLTADMDNVTYVAENDVYDICGLEMDVYYTYNQEILERVGSLDPCNDGGMIFELSGAENSMLFLADVGALLSDYVIEHHGDALVADYVQMGHHGFGGSSEDLLSLVEPKAAFFDSPDSIVEDPQYHVYEKVDLMEKLGAEMYFYRDAPHSVVIR